MIVTIRPDEKRDVQPIAGLIGEIEVGGAALGWRCFGASNHGP